MESCLICGEEGQGELELSDTSAVRLRNGRRTSAGTESELKDCVCFKQCLACRKPGEYKIHGVQESQPAWFLKAVSFQD